MIENIFEIYLIICGILVSLIILAGLVYILIRLIIEIYGRTVDLKTLKRALREYNNKEEKPIKLDVSKAFQKGDK